MVVLDSPKSGALLNGEVFVSARAASVSADIDRVVFTLPDGTELEDSSAPFEFEWDSTDAVDGFATITAKAYVGFDQVSTEHAVDVLVMNSAPCTTVNEDENVPLTIPNDGINDLVSSIDVDSGGRAVDVKLSLDLAHEDLFELGASLTSPSGTETVLRLRDYEADGGALLIDEPLGVFRGEPVEGRWELRIYDYFAPDVVFPTPAGTVLSWSLGFATACEAPSNEPDGDDPLERGLLDHIPLDDGADNLARPQENVMHGTTAVQGPVGRARRFNGTSDVIALRTSFSQPVPEISLCAWAKTSYAGTIMASNWATPTEANHSEREKRASDSLETARKQQPSTVNETTCTFKGASMTSECTREASPTTRSVFRTRPKGTLPGAPQLSAEDWWITFPWMTAQTIS